MVTTLVKLKKRCLPFLLFLCIVLSVCGCTNDVYAGKRPYNYPGTKWVSEDPDIVLTYPKTGEDSFEISGTSLDLPGDLAHAYGHGDLLVFHSNTLARDLFRGHCGFSPKKLTVQVEIDELFDGKYVGKTIVFYRSDLEVAEEDG